ncbi:MAG: Rrf2 family transcriptional regulator [Nitrospiraceae bacterium]|nr:Rrf2 family transcriptional regulator [Nitrospiraceae bacterium]
MLITQKSRYGLRAVFELAKRFGHGPTKICDIARAQAIPQRFLEAILRELKQAGMVESRRGSDGGYFLLRSPDKLTLDDVLVSLQGPIDPMGCIPGDDASVNGCDLYGRCVFLPIWEATRDAVQQVFRQATFSSLVQQERKLIAKNAQNMGGNI